LPLIQHKKYLEESGRAKLFESEFMKLSGKRSDFLLTPTNEEVLLERATQGLQSYRQLPIKQFQIADKFRDILKPKCLMRSRQFLMADMCSVDANEESLRKSAQSFEKLAEQVFRRMGINVFRLEKDKGNYVDYVIPCNEGETKVVLEKGKMRYALPDENATKSSSVGMYFIFNEAGNLPISYVDQQGNKQSVKFGTYGLGLQRCFHAIVDQNRDNLGLNFPKEVRPFNFSVIPINPNKDTHRDYANKVYETLSRLGKNPLLEDREVLMKKRAIYSDFMGIPYKLFIGDNEVQDISLILKNRGEDKGHKISLERAVELA